jgi:SNF2 family DNA or RNA helicase
MEFLNPGYLGSANDFRGRFAVPIERYRNSERAQALKNLIQPFVLRRLKTDATIIQDLPAKNEMKVFCNLTAEQASLYEAVVKEMLEKIAKSAGIERKGLVLATLLKLKPRWIKLHDRTNRTRWHYPTGQSSRAFLERWQRLARSFRQINAPARNAGRSAL